MPHCSGRAESHHHRALWLALISLTATIAGAAAGLLGWAGGQKPQQAVLTGGSAFGGAVLVLLAVFAFVVATDQREPRIGEPSP